MHMLWLYQAASRFVSRIRKCPNFLSSTLSHQSLEQASLAVTLQQMRKPMPGQSYNSEPNKACTFYPTLVYCFEEEGDQLGKAALRDDRSLAKGADNGKCRLTARLLPPQAISSPVEREVACNALDRQRPPQHMSRSCQQLAGD